MDLQTYVKILRERWAAALVAALTVFGAVVGFTLLQTPTYQATNQVFVQTDAGDSAADLNSGVSFASQQITSYANLATTPLVLQPVVEELDLDTTPQALAEQISTMVPPDTLILEISATSDDPTQAAAIANATSESLQRQVAELASNGSSSAVGLTVVSPAVEPTSPSAPNIPRNIVIGVVLASLAGLALAVIRDLADNRVLGAEDIETELDFPVIASIPTSRDAQQPALIAAQYPRSLQAEAYRELRTNLQFMGAAEGARTILLTSSLPGEGKTTAAINLAHVLAQSGRRVLLIDADLRRPSIHSYLNLEGNAGLTTVLVGQATVEDVTQPLKTEGIEVLAAGPVPPNPSELLGSDRMRQLLNSAMADYDFVVIDTSPLIAVTDPVVLARLVDGTVVVAQCELVKKRQLALAMEKLDAVDARALGVILNRTRIGSRSGYAYESHYTPEFVAPQHPAPEPPRDSIEPDIAPEGHGARAHSRFPSTLAANAHVDAGGPTTSRPKHRAPDSTSPPETGPTGDTWWHATRTGSGA